MDENDYHCNLLKITGNFNIPNESKYTSFQISWHWDDMNLDHVVFDFIKNIDMKTADIHIISDDKESEDDIHQAFKNNDIKNSQLSYFINNN